MIKKEMEQAGFQKNMHDEPSKGQTFKTIQEATSFIKGYAPAWGERYVYTNHSAQQRKYLCTGTWQDEKCSESLPCRWHVTMQKKGNECTHKRHKRWEDIPKGLLYINDLQLEHNAGCNSSLNKRRYAGCNSSLNKRRKCRSVVLTSTENTYGNDTHGNDTHANDTHTDKVHANDTHADDTRADKVLINGKARVSSSQTSIKDTYECNIQMLPDFMKKLAAANISSVIKLQLDNDVSALMKKYEAIFLLREEETKRKSAEDHMVNNEHPSNVELKVANEQGEHDHPLTVAALDASSALEDSEEEGYIHKKFKKETEISTLRPWHQGHFDKCVCQMTGMKWENEVFKIVGTCHIRMASVATLKDSVWLNDEIVNSFAYLTVTETVWPVTSPKCKLLNSHFPTTMADKNKTWEKKLKWTDKMDILKQDYVVIPIHTGISHWWLCIIDIRKKMIYCLDSFHHRDHDLEIITAYLMQECKKQDEDYGNWKTAKLYGPRQYDHDNCGVFVCIGISQVCSNGIPDLWKTKPTEEDKSRDYIPEELLKYRLFIFKCLQCRKYHFKENTCPRCGGWFADPAEEDERLHWIKCKKCTSLFHTSCVNNASGDCLCGKCQLAVLSNHQPQGDDAKTSTAISIALTQPISDTPQISPIETEKETPTPISIVSLPTDAELAKLPFYISSGNIAA